MRARSLLTPGEIARPILRDDDVTYRGNTQVEIGGNVDAGREGVVVDADGARDLGADFAIERDNFIVGEFEIGARHYHHCGRPAFRGVLRKCQGFGRRVSGYADEYRTITGDNIEHCLCHGHALSHRHVSELSGRQLGAEAGTPAPRSHWIGWRMASRSRSPETLNAVGRFANMPSMLLIFNTL